VADRASRPPSTNVAALAGARATGDKQCEFCRRLELLVCSGCVRSAQLSPETVLNMTRGRVTLELLKDEKARNTTFSKRKNGLFKKVLELSVLCDCEIGIVIFNHNGKLVEYSSKGEDSLVDLIRRWGAYTGTVESKSNLTALQPAAGRYEQLCPRWNVHPVRSEVEPARVARSEGSPRAPRLRPRYSSKNNDVVSAGEPGNQPDSRSSTQDVLVPSMANDDQFVECESLRKMCAEADMMQDLRRQYERYRERILRWSGKRRRGAQSTEHTTCSGKRCHIESGDDDSSRFPSADLVDLLKSEDTRPSGAATEETGSPASRKKRFRPEALSIEVDPLGMAFGGANNEKQSTGTWDQTALRPGFFASDETLRNQTPSVTFPEASTSGRGPVLEAPFSGQLYPSAGVGSQLSPRLSYRSLVSSYPILVPSPAGLPSTTGLGVPGVMIPTPTGASTRHVPGCPQGGAGTGAATATGTETGGPPSHPRTQPAMLSPTALIFEQMGLATPRESASWGGYNGTWFSFVGTGSTPRMGAYMERATGTGNQSTSPSQPFSASNDAEKNALDSPAGT
jgi:hypothetical protein